MIIDFEIVSKGLFDIRRLFQIYRILGNIECLKGLEHRVLGWKVLI